MIRIEPLEDSLPKDWRRAIRDHPFLAVSIAAALGVYVGRNHGRQLLSALVRSGLAFGVARLRGALGLAPDQPER
jgi:hypothetical protein